MNHIFLCGFMGCGKTTVGQAAAQLAGSAFIDLDEAIVLHAGKTISEIFSEHGEAYFRELETAVLAETAFSSKQSIVATGGGALISSTNAELCRKRGCIVFLDTPFEVCYSRIRSDPNRPVAASRSREELLELYRIRSDLYLANSTVVLPDGPLEERAAKIAALLQQQNGSNRLG
jgi:shikimate kinase